MAKIGIFVSEVKLIINVFANLTQSSQNCDKYTHLERSTQIPGL